MMPRIILILSFLFMCGICVTQLLLVWADWSLGDYHGVYIHIGAAIVFGTLAVFIALEGDD